MPDDYFEFTVRVPVRQVEEMIRKYPESSTYLTAYGVRSPRDIAIEKAAQYVLAAWDRWRPGAGDVYGMDKLRAALEEK